ncbi:hypothetical protein MNNICLKF_02813 [Synechococcus sp. CBW1107]|nr:hypothetical protein MNNICLKF_02813 [Synechococcus sp. CBW1107]
MTEDIQGLLAELQVAQQGDDLPLPLPLACQQLREALEG